MKTENAKEVYFTPKGTRGAWIQMESTFNITLEIRYMVTEKGWPEKETVKEYFALLKNPATEQELTLALPESYGQPLLTAEAERLREQAAEELFTSKVPEALSLFETSALTPLEAELVVASLLDRLRLLLADLKTTPAGPDFRQGNLLELICIKHSGPLL